MNAVVITGADGFIGSHLAYYFSVQDYKVYAVIMPESLTKARITNMEHIEIVEGYLSDYQSLAARLPNGPTALVHLAWNGVAPEARDIIEIQMQNIELSLSAVRLAHLIHAQRFIIPGSTSEYSYCGQLINETALPSPQNAYGAAKISTRYLCAALCKKLKLPCIYAVITGIYGADRSDNNVITYCVKQLLQKKEPEFTKLEQLWDYIHIDDLVHALFLVATKGKDGAFYSIGHGDNWPLYNYINIIRNRIDPALPLGIGKIPYMSDTLPSSCIDLTSIQEDTGFIPRISFEDGIESVIRNLRKRMEQQEEM